MPKAMDEVPNRQFQDLKKMDRNYYGNHLRITVASSQGGRKYMEDRVQIETVRGATGEILYTYLGVYDGHGGAEASEFVRQHLMANITSSPLWNSDEDDDILDAIRVGFLTTHDAMNEVVDSWPRTASGYRSTAGTTASVAVIRRGKIYTGHVGDSAIFLGKRSSRSEVEKFVPERLTIDHKPESEDEQSRIHLAGGQVALKSGVSRVVWTRPLKGHVGPIRRTTITEKIPFLAVARSLGDLWSYCDATKEYVVSPDPDLAVREINGDDLCLVLASDGLTNVMAPLQVMMVLAAEEELADQMENRKGTVHYSSLRLNRDKHSNHARSLVAAALKNWRFLRADNISVVSVLFDPEDANLVDECVGIEERFDHTESIDTAFCNDPECMIRVAPEGSVKLATYRTALLYKGAMDANFCNVAYNGPGFLSHEEELDLEARARTEYRQSLAAKKSNAYEDGESPPDDFMDVPDMNGENGNDDDEDEEEDLDKTPVIGLDDSMDFSVPSTSKLEYTELRSLSLAVADLASASSPIAISSTATVSTTSITVKSPIVKEVASAAVAVESTTPPQPATVSRGAKRELETADKPTAEAPLSTPSKDIAPMEDEGTDEEDVPVPKRTSPSTATNSMSPKAVVAPQSTPKKKKLSAKLGSPRSAKVRRLSLTRSASNGSDSHETRQTRSSARAVRSTNRPIAFATRGRSTATASSTTPKSKSRSVESPARSRSTRKSMVTKTTMDIKVHVVASVVRAPSPPVTPKTRLRSAAIIAAARTPTSPVKSKPSAVLKTPSALKNSASTSTPTKQAASSIVNGVTGSRKRPRRSSPSTASGAVQSIVRSASSPIHAGVTPFVNRLTLRDIGSGDGEYFATPSSAGRSALRFAGTGSGTVTMSPRMHSAPSTPIKDLPSPVAGSRWSLGKLDDMAATSGKVRAGAVVTNGREGEPPSKIRRIYGFMRRLVSFGMSADE